MYYIWQEQLATCITLNHQNCKIAWNFSNGMPVKNELVQSKSCLQAYK